MSKNLENQEAGAADQFSDGRTALTAPHGYKIVCCRTLLEIKNDKDHGPFGPLGQLTADAYRLVEMASEAGDSRLIEFARWMHERVCLARYQLRDEPWPEDRKLPPMPAPAAIAKATVIQDFDRVDGAKLERPASARKTGGAE